MERPRGIEWVRKICDRLTKLYAGRADSQTSLEVMAG